MNNNVFIIAEAGVNHNGSVKNAFDLISLAKKSGADCVKFQCFSADELVIKKSPKAEYQKENNNDTQYDMLKKLELNVNDFKEIKNYCDYFNIEFLSTPFSCKWVDELLNLGVSRFKIGSGNLKMYDMLKKIGKTKLPVILSTGMSSVEDISSSINVLKNEGTKDITLLHCVSLYPTRENQINLYSIQFLKERFGLNVGLSDHTSSIEMGGLAVAAGAIVLEKHFTIDKNMKGPDHKLSLTPDDFRKYVDYIRKVSEICGIRDKKVIEEELEIKKIVQTSVVTKVKIKNGEVITIDMLTEKRPALGISGKNILDIVGKKVNRDIDEDEIIKWEDIE